MRLKMLLKVAELATDLGLSWSAS